MPLTLANSQSLMISMLRQGNLTMEVGDVGLPNPNLGVSAPSRLCKWLFK